MSMFGDIMHKIFNAAETNMAGASTAAAGTAPTASAQSPAAPAMAGAAPTPGAAPAQPVDVGAVLSQMASQKGGGGNYQQSIVDLLKLLDLDSSLDARKQLASELSIHAGADGSAEENIALHKAVMQKLAENGGKVPESMKA